MSLADSVTAHETEVIRLYEIALPDATPFTTSDVASALGTDGLDSDYVDIFAVDVLDELGLRGYMIDGLGIPEDALDPYLDRITQVTGQVAVVLTKAFQGRALTLKNSHPLRLIGAFHEGQAPRIDVDLTSKAATQKTPKPTKKPKSQAAQSGMIATFVLLFMFLFAAVILWFA